MSGDIEAGVKLTPAQSGLLRALKSGIEVIREKGPPYRWKYANPTLGLIREPTVRKLLDAGLVRTEIITIRWHNLKLVLSTEEPTRHSRTVPGNHR